MSKKHDEPSKRNIPRFFDTELGRLRLCRIVIYHLSHSEKTSPSLLIKEDVVSIKRLVLIASDSDAGDNVDHETRTSSEILAQICCNVASHEASIADDSFIKSSSMLVSSIVPVIVGIASTFVTERWLLTSLGAFLPLAYKLCERLRYSRNMTSVTRSIVCLLEIMKRHKSCLKTSYDLVEVLVQSDDLVRKTDLEIVLIPHRSNNRSDIIKAVHRIARDSLYLYRGFTYCMMLDPFQTNAQNDDPSNHLCLIPDEHLANITNFEKIDDFYSSTEDTCATVTRSNVKKINSLVKFTNLQMSEMLRRLVCIFHPNSYKMRLDGPMDQNNILELFRHQNSVISEMIYQTSKKANNLVQSIENIRSYHKLCYVSEHGRDNIRSRGANELATLGFADVCIKPMSSTLLSVSDVIESIHDKMKLLDQVSNSDDEKRNDVFHDIYLHLQEIKKLSLTVESAACLGESMVSRLRYPQKSNKFDDINDNLGTKEDYVYGSSNVSPIAPESDSEVIENIIHDASSFDDDSLEDDEFERLWRLEKDALYKDQRDAKETNELFGELTASFALPAMMIVPSGEDAIVGQGEGEDEHDTEKQD